MELALNLAWMAMSALLLWLWTRHATKSGASRRTQFCALAILILIIFPVISVTDDLMAAQSPAELSCTQRRDLARSDAHPLLHTVTALDSTSCLELPFGAMQSIALGCLPAPAARAAVTHAIDNRPPPIA
jgi:hypothetical protein